VVVVARPVRRQQQNFRTEVGQRTTAWAAGRAEGQTVAARVTQSACSCQQLANLQTHVTVSVMIRRGILGIRSSGSEMSKHEGGCSSYASVQVVPRVFKVQLVVILLKFTFTAPTLL
jgi:hypothetical protein